MSSRRRRMRALLGTAAITAGALVGANAASAAPPDPAFGPIGSYATGLGDGSGETFAQHKNRLYVTSADDKSFDIVDISDPSDPERLHRIDLKQYGPPMSTTYGSPNSIDVAGDLIAVAVDSGDDRVRGEVLFFRPDGTFVRRVRAGFGPDMLTFTAGGRQVLVANEGEPEGYAPGQFDPPGTVSIIDTNGVESGRRPSVRTVRFGAFNEGRARHDELPDGIRLNGPGATVARDLEPEYVTVSHDGRTAYVSLQEANAIAVIDIARARVKRIVSMGLIDHSKPGSGIDASDDDGAINIANWPVFGMPMPDAIAAFRVKGEDYIITANEGDGREYDGFEDEDRVKDLTLDAAAFPDAAVLQQEANLGRLTVSVTDGLAGDGEYEKLHAFGSRSATILRPDGTRVWDSADGFERRVATEQPAFFNSDNDEDTFDTRSDAKGPEPEAVAVGTIRGRTYAFVGLERMGGMMVLDVSTPADSRIVQWANNRTYPFTVPPANPAVGPDSGPEIIRFVAAGKNPTKEPMVIVSNEVSGTVTFYAPLG